MTSHILRLSDLEAAAPGILKVIFGADGDFKNAPPFAGPVSVIKALPDLMAGGYLWIHGGLTPDGIWDGAGRLTPFDAVALDLRIPTVAARIAGLCAKAMRGSGDGWRVDRNSSSWMLARFVTPGMAQAYYWNFTGWHGHNGVNLTLDADDTRESVMGKLILALAPKIAALKIP